VGAGNVGGRLVVVVVGDGGWVLDLGYLIFFNDFISFQC
jgi:hypothetical protein